MPTTLNVGGIEYVLKSDYDKLGDRIDSLLDEVQALRRGDAPRPDPLTEEERAEEAADTLLEDPLEVVKALGRGFLDGIRRYGPILEDVFKEKKK